MHLYFNYDHAAAKGQPHGKRGPQNAQEEQEPISKTSKQNGVYRRGKGSKPQAPSTVPEAKPHNSWRPLPRRHKRQRSMPPNAEELGGRQRESRSSRSTGPHYRSDGDGKRCGDAGGRRLPLSGSHKTVTSPPGPETGDEPGGTTATHTQCLRDCSAYSWDYGGERATGGATIHGGTSGATGTSPSGDGSPHKGETQLQLASHTLGYGRSSRRSPRSVDRGHSDRPCGGAPARPAGREGHTPATT